jgi:hypothetical protein
MEIEIFSDKGGRRSKKDRRYRAYFGPVLEKRAGQNRRSGHDRRKFRNPIIRITGDERREVFLNYG